jgi:hypothetical protein
MRDSAQSPAPTDLPDAPTRAINHPGSRSIPEPDGTPAHSSAPSPADDIEPAETKPADHDRSSAPDLNAPEVAEPTASPSLMESALSPAATPNASTAGAESDQSADGEPEEEFSMDDAIERALKRFDFAFGQTRDTEPPPAGGARGY